MSAHDNPGSRWLLPALVDRPASPPILPMAVNRSKDTSIVTAITDVALSMLRFSIKVLALILLVLAVSYGVRAEVSAPNQPESARSARTFALRGDLTAALAMDLKAALRAGFRRIVITSRGGEVLVARAMADLLNRHEAVLVAQGQCHSACTYMWLATKRRALERGADLALHATFDDDGPNDFGELWLKELGRSDLARWARTRELHHLEPQEIEPAASTQ